MFLLDANVFITASRQYYSPDIAPTFWEWLAEQHAKGNVASVAAVRKEIDDSDGGRGTGHLETWAAHLPPSFWVKPDAGSVRSMTKLSLWATHSERAFTVAAKDEFLRAADYYLVAQAHAGKHMVVTLEQPAPKAKKKIKIPDACLALGADYREPFSVYRELGLRFR